MITAISVKNKVIVTVNSENDKQFVLERKRKGADDWEVFTDSGFVSKNEIDNTENNNIEENQSETNTDEQIDNEETSIIDDIDF